MTVDAIIAAADADAAHALFLTPAGDGRTTAPVTSTAVKRAPSRTPSRPHAVDVPERCLLSADDLSKLMAPTLARLVVVAAR